MDSVSTPNKLDRNKNGDGIMIFIGHTITS